MPLPPSPLAYQRWHSFALDRVVDMSLGYPVLVVDDDGNLVTPKYVHMRICFSV